MFSDCYCARCNQTIRLHEFYKILLSTVCNYSLIFLILYLLYCLRKSNNTTDVCNTKHIIQEIKNNNNNIFDTNFMKLTKEINNNWDNTLLKKVYITNLQNESDIPLPEVNVSYEIQQDFDQLFRSVRLDSDRCIGSNSFDQRVYPPFPASKLPNKFN